MKASLEVPAICGGLRLPAFQHGRWWLVGQDWFSRIDVGYHWSVVHLKALAHVNYQVVLERVCGSLEVWTATNVVNMGSVCRASFPSAGPCGFSVAVGRVGV